MKKACTKCHEEKDLDDFYASKNAPMGRQSWCKACSKYSARVKHREEAGLTVGILKAKKARANRQKATTKARVAYDEGTREALKERRSVIPDSFELETGIRGFKDWTE